MEEVKNLEHAERITFKSKVVPVELSSGTIVHVCRLSKTGSDRVREEMIALYSKFSGQLIEALGSMLSPKSDGSETVKFSLDIDLGALGETLKSVFLEELPGFIDRLVGDCVPELKSPELRGKEKFDELWALAGIALDLNIRDSEHVKRFFSAFSVSAQSLSKTRQMLEAEEGESGGEV